MGLPVRYLQVHIDLPNNDHQTQMFDQYMRQLLPTFENTPWPGWELFMSATHEADRDPSNDKSDDKYKSYLHIWRVRDYNTVPYIMEYFDDDPTYVSLDLMVEKEVQDFYEALVYNPQSKNAQFDPADGAKFYLTIEMDMIQDAQLLTDFRACMTDVASNPSSPMREKYGWELVHGTYSQTGRLRRYWHTFRTGSSMPDAEEAINWLTSQEAVKNVLNPDVDPNPQWKVWEPIDYLSQS